MSALSADSDFYLEILQRVLTASSKPGVESLSVVERTIYFVNHFDYDQLNGGLSQFFYNCDCSLSFAEATASALYTVGAPQTAEVVRGAAALFTHPPDGTLGSTWREYLKAVDPKSRLNDYEARLPVAGEDIDSLLERFVLQNRHELKKPTA